MTITHKEFMASLDTPEQWRRQRDEFAAALAEARHTIQGWRPSSCSAAALRELANPAACLRAHDEEKDAIIRHLRHLLAEAGQDLLTHRKGSWEGAHRIARALGYEGELTYDKVDRFLSGVSVQDAQATNA